MFNAIRKWRDRRIITRSSITENQWQAAFAHLPLLKGLSPEEKQALRDLAILFLYRKEFEPKLGLSLSDQMLLIIALQACLPILKLGLSCYDNWYTVIIYPSVFVAKNIIRDEAGVEHRIDSHLNGEAWHRGPVVLSWDRTEHAGELDGHNLVIHEFAHKLDMQNGAANGFPPLHSGMQRTAWANAFMAAYEDFQKRTERGEHIGIDTYAATAPAEFFAVVSEVFFERPTTVVKYYPDTYEQLRQYYKQDPLQRLSPQT
jgi:hypothetical protein